MAGGISLERVPLGWRLAALVAAPLLVITIVAGMRLSSLWNERQEGLDLVESLGAAALAETAISRLQDERDVTAHLLAFSTDAAARPALERQLNDARSASDRAFADAGLSRAVPPFDLSGFARPSRTATGDTLESLDHLRLLVDRRALPAADVIHLYSVVIAGCLTDVNLALGAEGDSGPTRDLLAHTSSLSDAEAFIQARAWGTLLNGSPDSGAREWILLATLARTEQFFLDRARAVGSTTSPPRSFSAPGSTAVRGPLGPPGGRSASAATMTPSEWHELTAPRVAELSAATDASRQRLMADARQIVAGAEREFAVIGALAIVLVGLVAFGALRVSRSVSRPLERLAVGARAASTGALSEVDLPDSRDAIGEIGRAYGLLDQYLHHVAGAAEEIAEGDLTRQIKPRSPQDRLGMALRSMTNQLSSMVTHSQRRSEALEETVGELQETAARDPLTGLLNRGRFIELVSESIEAAETTNSQLGILFLDLDGFKHVNDQLGHAAGDELLRQVSSRILGVLRIDDVVARLGGDEFTVLISSGFDVIAVEAVARQIVELVATPYFVQGETVEVRASVGLARYPEHGDTVEALLEAADQAMYRAKNAGGNEARVAAA